MPWVGRDELLKSPEQPTVDPWSQASQPMNSLYKPEYDERAKQYCMLGAVDSELAVFFGVNINTVRRWLVEHTSFAKAVDDGRKHISEFRNARVERALYNRAVGYDHEATKFFCSDGQVIAAPYIEHNPPDVNACKLWLINRSGWVDKLTHAGDKDNPLQVENDVLTLTPDQVKERLRQRGLPDQIFD